MELSPERGRYALLYSVAEDNSLNYSVDLARFAAPDVAYTISGKYASLFQPGVSFISLPGYLIGRYFGLAQVGSFAVIAIFALINFWLVRVIAIRAGANPLAATLGGFIFLFATPAFSYAVTLYQHHISTFLILMSLYLILRFKSVISYILVWMMMAFSVAVDYPNFFMMLPIGLLAIYRAFTIQKLEGFIKINLQLLRFFSVIGVILPVVFFLWFNQASYDNPLQLSGTLQQASQIDIHGGPVIERPLALNTKNNTGSDTSNEAALAYFNNRNITNGFYTFFLSPDRGMLIFTPVILFGFVGFVWALRRGNQYAPLIFAVLGVNIVLYSMWGDPYGGWAFGARYLIPGYAMLAIFISLLLTYWSRKTIFVWLFFIVLAYSIAVNSLGALTSNRNPPKIEAAALERVSLRSEPYTYKRNMNMLDINKSKSFVYSTFVGKYMSAWGFYTLITVALIYAAGAQLVLHIGSARPTHLLHPRRPP